jgi:hypothetical protein
VEVEDRGLGITAGALADINARLANPPEFDLADSDQLGLFVVSRLADRHKIRVSLRGSPYGGTTAIVLMPHGVVVPQNALPGRDDHARALPSGPGSGPALPIGGATGGQDFGSSDAGQGGWLRSGPLELEPVGAPAQPAAGPQQAAGPPWERMDPGTEPFPRSRRDTATPASAGSAAARSAVPGLPQRVRQASLAPQLRDRPPPAAGNAGDTTGRDSAAGGGGPGPVSPEKTRALFTSLQQGWRRGRSQAGQTGGGPGPAPDAKPAAGDHESGP